MHDGNDFEFSKDLEVDVDLDIDLEVDVDVDVYKDVDIYVDIRSDVDLDGNTAELNFDVQAIGDNTLVEGDVWVLTVDNELSSITGHLYSAAD
jgi:hypothetical protein